MFLNFLIIFENVKMFWIFFSEWKNFHFVKIHKWNRMKKMLNLRENFLGILFFDKWKKNSGQKKFVELGDIFFLHVGTKLKNVL